MPRRGLDVFDLFGDDLFSSLFGTEEGARSNVLKTETGSQIEIEAPGLTRDDFNVKLDGNTLTISALAEKRREDTHTREFYRRSFSRSYTVPDGVLAEGIKASYEAGILRVDVSYEDPVKREPVTIDIQ